MNWYDVAPEEPYSVHLDTKIVPAEMMRDYNANLTGEEIAEKWGTSVYIVRKIITERGVTWKHPESRQE